MRLLLYAEENPEQIYEKGLNSQWVRLRRRAAQEIAHRLLVERKLPGGSRVQLALTHEWLESELNSSERALQSVLIAVSDEHGECLRQARIPATDLAMHFARRTINGMVSAQQVQPDHHVVFLVAGVPADEGSEFKEQYRLPRAIDLADHVAVFRSIEKALEDQRCEGCEKAICDKRPVAISESVLEDIASWHAQHSDNGATEAGGVLLGYVLQQAPGEIAVLVVDQIGVVDPQATLVRWEMRGEEWDTVLRELAERQAASDPDLVICGSWHSHDLKAIREAAGEKPSAEDCAKGTILLPSPDDLLFWETDFGLPHHLNSIFNAHTKELTLYRWQHGQPKHCLPLWVPDVPKSLGSDVVRPND